MQNLTAAFALLMLAGAMGVAFAGEPEREHDWLVAPRKGEGAGPGNPGAA